MQYLAKLQSAEFIYETNLFPEVEYSFKHALTTEVAYGALLHERRTFLHARIVKALEEMTENISHDHLEKLAHHAFQGEIWDKAVSYSKEAGSKAMGRSAYRGAVIYFDQGRASLEHLPKSRHISEQAIDLRLDLRNALLSARRTRAARLKIYGSRISFGRPSVISAALEESLATWSTTTRSWVIREKATEASGRGFTLRRPWVISPFRSS